MNNSAPVKTVRFAPSPTGHLHIGGVRTALFNYFFVKNQKGIFVLRIEDTDISRSSPEMADEIVKGLQWLGILWDQGPFYQSHKFQIYRETAFKLLEQKKAYRCFCTPAQIEANRKESQHKDKSQQLFKYDRTCLNLSNEQVNQNLQKKIPFVIRFLIPEGMTYFKDRIHKEMKSANSELEDFVILKSDNSPTYHLSVVVDDHQMGITDVVRGDDHISNTFKQILLFKALDHKPPKYAHLPLILGADKKKLSKRHGETSILQFKEKGYLPEAIVNYLSQLSWIPADTKKIFPTDQLIRQFSISKLSKNSPVFDYDKLRFINGLAIQQKDSAQLLAILEESPSFIRAFSHINSREKIGLIHLIKPRMKTLLELEKKFALYMSPQLDYNSPDGIKLKKDFPAPSLMTNLRLLLPALEAVQSFDKESVEHALRACAGKNNLKAADLIHPSRFALTSETVSPSLFDLFAYFGKDVSLKRIRSLIEYLDGS